MQAQKAAALSTAPQSTVVAVTGVEGSVLSMGDPVVSDEEQLEFDFDSDEDA